MVYSSAQDLPAGLDKAVVYFVVNATTNDLELSLTSGGAAVALSDNGTGAHTLREVTLITLSEVTLQGAERVLSGSADVSGQMPGTDMGAVVTTHNTKALKLHGIAVQWS